MCKTSGCFTLLGLGIGAILIIVWLRTHPANNSRTEPMASRESSEAREEEHDAPEPVTHWTPLDDTGTDHRCNQDTTNAEQVETFCATNPLDPEVIIAGGMDWRSGTLVAGYYRTTDGGNSWQDVLLAHGPYALGSGGDPWIAADATGKFYAFYCATILGGQSIACLQTSHDNRATWSAPVTVNTVGDKTEMICDQSSGSPYLNNCYMVTSMYVQRSTDGGATFSNLFLLSQNSEWGALPAVAVGANGEVYAAWFSINAPHAVRFRRSMNGAVTWDNEVTAAVRTDDFQMNHNPCAGYRMIHQVSLACDNSQGPRRGEVYLCCDMPMSINSTDDNIYFIRSLDGGVTWSDTVRVNDDRTTHTQWWPCMTIHPRTGDIAVSWLDSRDDPANCRYSVYGSISTDGGVTWSPNMAISDQLVDSSLVPFLGDYTGVTSTSVGFLSSWPDTRNGDADIYAAWWNNGDSLTLTSPNGGEVFAVQQPCTVRWHYRYAPDSLMLQLNRNFPSGTWDSLTTQKSDSGNWVWYPTEPSTSSA